MNFYNEIDPYAAQWLRNLIAEGHIPPGVVDERSIEDITPDELSDFTQCHFFAGLGGWPLALRMAGVSDDTRLWTGSCPCQPFSAAGKGGGFADERHLWPAFDWLIGKCRPDLVLGEQVEGPAGRTWLDLVATDLEGHGYAFGTAVFPAAGVGAPQIRHRTYWTASRMVDADNERERSARRYEARSVDTIRSGETLRLANANSEGLGVERGAGIQRTEIYDVDGRGEDSRLARADEGQRGRLAASERDADGQAGGWQQGDGGAAGDCEASRVADADMQREARAGLGEANSRWPSDGPVGDRAPVTASPVNGFWRASDWLYCRDDKWRPVEPSSFPLATGVPARVGKLRAAGNAICVPQAVAFVEAVVAAQGVALPTDVRHTQQLAAE